jgi:hypothetical protein
MVAVMRSNEGARFAEGYRLNREHQNNLCHVLVGRTCTSG